MYPNTQIVFLFFLFIQVAAYAIPTTSFNSISTRAKAPDSTQLKPEKVTLDGREYTATPLSHGDQGKFSHAFRIEGGFRVRGKLVPAIMKRVFEREGSDNPNSKTLKEIGFLKRSSIDLHLFSEWSKTKMSDLPYQIDIVVKDLRGSDPPFKTFHEWYQENQSIEALGGLFNARENIKERLMWYAQHENLLYNDFNMRNIFLQEQAILMRSTTGTTGRYMEDNVQIIPADWGPTDGNTPGVVDIVDSGNRKELIEEYEEELDNELEEHFSVEVVAALLRQLRSTDIITIQFEGNDYQLLHIREIGVVTLYSIVGGFNKGKNGKKEVIPAIMSVRDMEDDDGEAQASIEAVKDGGVFLSSEESGGELRIVFEDRRGEDSSDDSESDG